MTTKKDCVLIDNEAIILFYPFNRTVILNIGDRRIAYSKEEIIKSLVYMFNKGKYHIYISPDECYIEVKEEFK